MASPSASVPTRPINSTAMPVFAAATAQFAAPLAMVMAICSTVASSPGAGAVRLRATRSTQRSPKQVSIWVNIIIAPLLRWSLRSHRFVPGHWPACRRVARCRASVFEFRYLRKRGIMRRLIYFSLVLVIALQAVPAQDKNALPAQVQRGRELFIKTTKGIPCGTCHSLAGVGTAVGPDLRTLASAVSPGALVQAMHMTMTAYVQEAKLADGSKFPAMLKGKQGDRMELWDLSQTPPVLRTLAAKDVVSMEANTTWKHPPASAEYTTQEVADIVGFLKWAAKGSTKEIKPEEVEFVK